MGFNEKVHAFIAAKYYVCLTETFGERGKAAFIHATQYYAEQRGRRMAQRAIRDGKKLDFENYSRYGEWVSTEEIAAQGCQNVSKVVSQTPDRVIQIVQCPWHAQFKEMGLCATAGAEYCKHLDNSIARGFNPYLTYEVEQTLHTAPYCIHRMKDAGIDETSDLSRDPKNMRSFEYHCAHSYWAYSEVTRAIFRGEGENVCRKVLADFRDEYGDAMADAIARYEGVNFNVCG